MSEVIKREARVVQPEPPKEESKKKGKPEKVLPSWNFPLKGRSVRAKNLAEATKKVNE